MAKEKKEEKYLTFSETVHGIIGVGFVVFVIHSCNGVLKRMDEVKKNPLVYSKSNFQSSCEGIELDNLRENVRELRWEYEQASMKKRRAKHQYKQGFITISRYREVKARDSVAFKKWSSHLSCFDAKNDYETALKKHSEPLKRTEKDLEVLVKK